MPQLTGGSTQKFVVRALARSKRTYSGRTKVRTTNLQE